MIQSARLVHTETGVEYYQDGSLVMPSDNQKLLWSLIGLPSNIERVEMTFETELNEYRGFSKRDIEVAVNKDLKSNVYDFLPPMGFSQNIEIRFDS